MSKEASENPMRVLKVVKLVLSVRVGEGGDRLVRAEKALQQAERRIQSHRKSRKSGRREEELQMIQDIAESNRGLQERDHQGGDQFLEYDVPNIQMIVEKIEQLEEAH